MQTKIVGLLLVLGLAAAVLPIINLAERTKVQDTINDYLNNGNQHILKDRKQVEDYLFTTVEAIVGDDAALEIIQYQHEGIVPVDLVAKPEEVPSLPGIKRNAGYYEVSALITRVYWTQTKLTGKRLDEDGNYLGRCYLCESDARAQRTVFAPRDVFGSDYMRAPGDLDFVKNPELLFEQF